MKTVESIERDIATAMTIHGYIVGSFVTLPNRCYLMYLKFLSNEKPIMLIANIVTTLSVIIMTVLTAIQVFVK